MFNRTLDPYFMEFLDAKSLVTLCSLRKKYMFFLKTYGLLKEKDEINIFFDQACFLNNWSLIEYSMSMGGSGWQQGAENGAKGGHLDVVKFFIKKGAICGSWIMKSAIIGNHKHVVDFLISIGINNWNRGMYYAVEGGHKDLVELFISKGANNWNRGMYYAAEGGHKDLVEFFKSKLNS